MEQKSFWNKVSLGLTIIVGVIVTLAFAVSMLHEKQDTTPQTEAAVQTTESTPAASVPSDNKQYNF